MPRRDAYENPSSSRGSRSAKLGALCCQCELLTSISRNGGEGKGPETETSGSKNR